MKKTIVGALREHVIAADLPGIGNKFYLDFAPANTTPPYITCNDFVSLAPTLKGDGKTSEVNRNLQVNLWQRPDDEDAQLPSQVFAAIDGALLHVEGMSGARAVSAESLTRLPGELDEDIIHHEMTFGVVHPPHIA